MLAVQARPGRAATHSWEELVSEVSSPSWAEEPGPASRPPSIRHLAAETHHSGSPQLRHHRKGFPDRLCEDGQVMLTVPDGEPGCERGGVAVLGNTGTGGGASRPDTARQRKAVRAGRPPVARNCSSHTGPLITDGEISIKTFY